MSNKTIYCPYCNKYGLESTDEEQAICPDCESRCQWENEVALVVKG